MIRIILTRHGETEWNLAGRVQGRLDSPLTGKGVNQARALAAKLRAENINLIYSSDAPRALATATEIQQALGINAPIRPVPDLREFSFGEWEGQVWSDLREQFPEVFAVWDTKPHAVTIPGGESMQLVVDRVWRFFQHMLPNHPEQTLCIVTHGLTLKLLVGRAFGFGVHQWAETPWQFNTALNILNWDGRKFQAEILGDCSHLDGIS